jgi:hypothetical protein
MMGDMLEELKKSTVITTQNKGDKQKKENYK